MVNANNKIDFFEKKSKLLDSRFVKLSDEHVITSDLSGFSKVLKKGGISILKVNFFDQIVLKLKFFLYFKIGQKLLT